MKKVQDSVSFQGDPPKTFKIAIQRATSKFGESYGAGLCHKYNNVNDVTEVGAGRHHDFGRAQPAWESVGEGCRHQQLNTGLPTATAAI